MAQKYVCVRFMCPVNIYTSRNDELPTAKWLLEGRNSWHLNLTASHSLPVSQLVSQWVLILNLEVFAQATFNGYMICL